MASLSVLYPRTLRHPSSAPRFGPATACAHVCPNGSKCCLNAGIPHTLHICPDMRCACHSEARYLDAKRARLATPETAG